MRYLTVGEVLELYRRVVAETGGATGLQDLPALLSSLAQPRMTFAGSDLYPSIGEKAAALAFSVVMNHPFLDGNKRAAHAAAEAFLHLNGYELRSPVDEQERTLLALADGKLERDEFTAWVVAHTYPLQAA